MLVHAIQLCAKQSPEQNLQTLAYYLDNLPTTRPCLVCLPESWLCFADAQTQLNEAKKHSQYRAQLQQLAKQHNIWLAAGTIAVAVDDERYVSASFVFDPQGAEQAQYNKIHLFDVHVEGDARAQYQESARTEAGEQVVVCDTPFAKLGLSVCYDMRFSELYREQVRLGADILLIPSAFTVPTGRAHWHTLLKARAIESQCFVVAAGLFGRNNSQWQHDNQRETYGHSVIISPWGEVLAELAHGQGVISCELDLQQLLQCRERMPMQAHRQARKVSL